MFSYCTPKETTDAKYIYLTNLLNFIVPAKKLPIILREIIYSLNYILYYQLVYNMNPAGGFIGYIFVPILLQQIYIGWGYLIVFWISVWRWK